MSLATIMLIVFALVLIGVLPAWLSSKGWGYGSGGSLSLGLFALPLLLLTGRL